MQPWNQSLNKQNIDPFLTELKTFTEGGTFDRFFLVKEGSLAKTNVLDFVLAKVEGLFSSQDLTKSCLVEYKALQFLTRGKDLIYRGFHFSTDDVERVKALAARLGLTPENQKEHPQLRNLVEEICNCTNPAFRQNPAQANDFAHDFFVAHKPDLDRFNAETLNASEIFNETFVPKSANLKGSWKADPKIALLAIFLLGMGIYAFSHFGQDTVLALPEKGDPDPKRQELIERASLLASDSDYNGYLDLGREYELEKNYEMAVESYAKGAKKGIPKFMDAIDNIKNNVETHKIEEIRSAFKAAHTKIIERAIERGESKWVIALLYQDGGDLASAILLHRELAQSGNQESMLALEKLNKKEAIPDIEAIRAAFNEANTPLLQKAICRIRALIANLISQESFQNP